MRRTRRRRRGRSLARPPVWAAAVVSFAAVVGLTAANTVAASRAHDDNRAVVADDLAPTECASIVVTGIVVGLNGTTNADLLVGSSAGESLDGDKGDDCILGGGGNDTLRGSQGTDVCVGGPGVDTFHPTCETQIQ